MSAKKLTGKQHNQYVTNTIYDPYAEGFTTTARGRKLEGQFVTISPNTKLNNRLARLAAWGEKMVLLKEIHKTLEPQIEQRREQFLLLEKTDDKKAYTNDNKQ